MEAAIGAGVGFYDNRRIASKPEGMTIVEHRDAMGKSPGKRPNPLSAYSPAFRHRAIALCFAICFVPRFVIWPHMSSYVSFHVSPHSPICRHMLRPTLRPMAHAHDPISRHVATPPFITNGRIQAVLRDDSRPGSAERTMGPEAIGCPDPGNRAQRRLVVRARATGLRDDWLSGPDRTTDSGAIRSLDPIMLW